MTMLWADGFDHWGTSANLVGPYTTVDTGYLQMKNDGGRTGNGYLFATGWGWAAANIGAPKNVIYTGCGMWGVQPGNGGKGISCQNGGAQNSGVRLIFQSSVFVVYERDNLIYTSPTGMYDPNAKDFFELGVKIDNVNGSIEVRKNGVQVYFVNGRRVGTTGSGINQVVIGQVGSQAGEMYFDDFYVNDDQGLFNNTFLCGPSGTVRMRTGLMTSDGQFSQWLPASGTDGYPMVNSVPPNDAKYLSGANVGDKSSFRFDGVPANTSAIYGVALFNRAMKTDVGSLTISNGLIMSTGTLQATPFDPSINFTYKTPDIFETDAEGNYFDRFRYNEAEFLIERAS